MWLLPDLPLTPEPHLLQAPTCETECQVGPGLETLGRGEPHHSLRG